MMNSEYLVYFREPLTTPQRAALEARFPSGRLSTKPKLLFLNGRSGAIIDFARDLGFYARLVAL